MAGLALALPLDLSLRFLEFWAPLLLAFLHHFLYHCVGVAHHTQDILTDFNFFVVFPSVADVLLYSGDLLLDYTNLGLNLV